MFRSLVLVGALAPLVVLAGCSSKPKQGFDNGDGTSDASTGGSGSGTGDSVGFTDVDGAVSLSGDCRAGHYSGTFLGTYSSYLTFIGFPIPVAGDVSLTLTQSDTGGTGEFHTYTISDGTIAGTADGAFPYFCKMIGTLDCASKKLVGGGLRDCIYCVGPALNGSLADGGTCLVEGHFAGPLTADYDSKKLAFVNGGWDGNEQAALNDGGLPEGGGIDDAGFYIGPGNYGGKGSWNAALGDGGP